jgi:hypothetical protein
MMRQVLRYFVFSVLLSNSLIASAPIWAADHSGSRQSFGDWHRHQNGFSFRPYYYKPNPQFVGFKHHYVVHFQSHPEHNYFYNPYNKQFWGRCPVATEGKPSYSLLAAEDRNGDINKIPESAFPKAGPMPPIPESTDGATLDLPPDDLPGSDALPTSNAK